MRLSQLTRRMDRSDEICVCLFGAPVKRMILYRGAVRGIKRADALNGMFVNHVCSDGDMIVVEVKERSAVGTTVVPVG